MRRGARAGFSWRASVVRARRPAASRRQATRHAHARARTHSHTHTHTQTHTSPSAMTACLLSFTPGLHQHLELGVVRMPARPHAGTGTWRSYLTCPRTVSAPYSYSKIDQGATTLPLCLTNPPETCRLRSAPASSTAAGWRHGQASAPGSSRLASNCGNRSAVCSGQSVSHANRCAGVVVGAVRVAGSLSRTTPRNRVHHRSHQQQTPTDRPAQTTWTSTPCLHTQRLCR